MMVLVSGLVGVSVFGLAYVGLGWLSEWWCKADPIEDAHVTMADLPPDPGRPTAHG